MNNSLSIHLWVILSLNTLLPVCRTNITTERKTIYHLNISPRKNEIYDQAEFSVYLPGEGERINGLIVHQHGCGRNGLAIVYDYHWRSLAEKHGWALVGTHYTVSRSCSAWNNPENGSGRAFLAAMSQIGKESGHEEMDSVPWVLWGHSGGATWSCLMLNKYPERTAGLFARSNAVALEGNALLVPVIISMGLGEKNHPQFNRVWENCVKAFTHNRKMGGNTALLVDPITAHDCGNSRLIAIPFVDKCIKQFPNGRIPLSIPDKEFMLAMKDSLALPKNGFHWSWFISEEIKEMSSEYIESGWVTDITPPQSPYGLKFEKVTENGVRITWKANADIQSGIKQFYLFRNDSLIKHYIGYNDDYNRKNFQFGNFGDTPEPEVLYENVDHWIPQQMEMTDYGLQHGETYIYQLKQENWSGLASELSEKLSITF